MLIIYKFLLLPLGLIQSEKIYHVYLQMCAGIMLYGLLSSSKNNFCFYH